MFCFYSSLTRLPSFAPFGNSGKLHGGSRGHYRWDGEWIHINGYDVNLVGLFFSRFRPMLCGLFTPRRS